MNTVAIRLDEKTALELGQLARERSVEPSALANEAIRAYLRSAARDDMDQEAEAFRRLHPELLATIRANTQRFTADNWWITTWINWLCTSASKRAFRDCRS